MIEVRSPALAASGSDFSKEAKQNGQYPTGFEERRRQTPNRSNSRLV
jgi:hypothetical protein